MCKIDKFGRAEIKRCSGHCCKNFTLQMTPKMLREGVELARNGKSMIDVKGKEYNVNYKEIKKINDMVIYLGQWRRDPATHRMFADPNHKVHVYTCKLFDKRAGNCTDYENRPQMCRAYPNGAVCRYVGCTMEMSPINDDVEENKLSDGTETESKK